MKKQQQELLEQLAKAKTAKEKKSIFEKLKELKLNNEIIK